MHLIRIFDIAISTLVLVTLSPLLVLLALICFVETREPIFRQTRVGLNSETFVMLKFRTMRSDTPEIPTHLVDPRAVTRSGRILRRSKLDEIPQLLNVLLGEMSLVGARPCLPTQIHLMEERRRRGVLKTRPGITGKAQLAGVDMRDPTSVAELDQAMLDELNLRKYFKYIAFTILKIVG